MRAARHGRQHELLKIRVARARFAIGDRCRRADGRSRGCRATAFRQRESLDAGRASGHSVPHKRTLPHRPGGRHSRPAAATVGVAEQFHVYDLGTGLFALKSVVSDKFLSAQGVGPILANGESIGDAAGIPATRSRRRAGAASLRRREGVRVCGAGGQRQHRGSEALRPAFELLHVQTVQAPTTPSLTITSPVPGSVLLATSATFSWDRPATTPGSRSARCLAHPTSTRAARSGRDGAHGLQSAVERVDRIRPGGPKGRHAHGRADGEYIAAVRKGVAVITDFADRRLEDWTGSGMEAGRRLGRAAEEHGGSLGVAQPGPREVPLGHRPDSASGAGSRGRLAGVGRLQRRRRHAGAPADPDSRLRREQRRRHRCDVADRLERCTSPFRSQSAERAATPEPICSSMARRAAAWWPEPPAISTTSWRTASGCRTCMAPTAR